MDEKLKKALRTSKQGVWALLILLIGIGVVRTLFATVTLEDYFPGVISVGALITGLVLYGKGKYVTGAEVIQWVGIGTLVSYISDVVITYAFTGVFILKSIMVIISLTLPILIAIVLIVDALRVIRLTEEPGHVNKVGLPAIIIIAVIVIINILTAMQAKQQVDDLMSGIKDQIQGGLVNKDEDENKTDGTEQDEGNGDDKETENKNPYANYKNITWAGKEDDIKGNIYIKIENNILKITYEDVEKTISYTMQEQPKSVVSTLNGGEPSFYVLTQSGKVYQFIIEGYELYEVKQVTELSKYKIIEMTTQTGGVFDKYGLVYFLTEEGKLITKDGITFETQNKNFVGIIEIGFTIPFDSDSYGYYWDSKNKDYVQIVSKSTGAKLTFSKVYEVEDGAKLLVQTAYNKLFEYDGKSNKAVQVGETVKSVNALGENRIIITFTDGTTKIYDNVGVGWDIKKNDVIQSFKLFDPYANYKNMTWRTTTKSDDYQIEDGTVYCYSNNKKTKVTGITGNSKKFLAHSTGGTVHIYVLVNEGVIYRISDTLEPTATKVADLSKYEVIDIISLNNYTIERIYYLTVDGKLIDKNGVSFDKYGFVYAYHETPYPGAGDISIDKNGFGYHYNENTKLYEVIVNGANSQKLSISQMFRLENRNVIIITTDNKLFEYYGNSNKATQVKGTVKSVKKSEEESWLDFVVIFEDKTEKKYNYLTSGYDVKNKKEIDINSMEDYSIYNLIEARKGAELANVRAECVLLWADLALNNNGIAKTDDGKEATADYYYKALANSERKYGTEQEIRKKYKITIKEAGTCPTVERID